VEKIFISKKVILEKSRKATDNLSEKQDFFKI
jgi:hypothetical protein